jgi:hypothetical protein
MAGVTIKAGEGNILNVLGMPLRFSAMRKILMELGH